MRWANVRRQGDANVNVSRIVYSFTIPYPDLGVRLPKAQIWSSSTRLAIRYGFSSTSLTLPMASPMALLLVSPTGIILGLICVLKFVS